MGILEEFAAWLRKWFSAEEVEDMLAKPWRVSEGVSWRVDEDVKAMNIEEFLILAASFTVERALGRRGVEYVADLTRVYAFDVETRTVVIAASFKEQTIEPKALEAFLSELEKQAEEAKEYMALRVMFS